MIESCIGARYFSWLQLLSTCLNSYFWLTVLVPAGTQEADEAEVEEEEEEEEEVKPVKKNAKKEVEEEEAEDKREHVNIIFIGHVGKSFNMIHCLIFIMCRALCWLWSCIMASYNTEGNITEI